MRTITFKDKGRETETTKMLTTIGMGKPRADNVAVIKDRMLITAITKARANRHSLELRAVEEETATEMRTNQEELETTRPEETKIHKIGINWTSLLTARRVLFKTLALRK